MLVFTQFWRIQLFFAILIWGVMATLHSAITPHLQCAITPHPNRHDGNRSHIRGNNSSVKISLTNPTQGTELRSQKLSKHWKLFLRRESIFFQISKCFNFWVKKNVLPVWPLPLIEEERSCRDRHAGGLWELVVTANAIFFFFCQERPCAITPLVP